MIIQPTTVELTKVHYYDPNKNVFIPTISREIYDNHVNRNVVIKKNLFGHKWVLKINEVTNSDKSKWRLIVYVFVFSCITIAVAFGIFFTLESKNSLASRSKNKTSKATNQTEIFLSEPVPAQKNLTHENVLKHQIHFCQNCPSRDRICLKLTEIDTPKCMQPVDKKDPTGCGGFCSINTQFCQLLDSESQIYQCSNLKNILKCPVDTFNCGNRCISQSKRCDGIIHCSNKSDERACACDLELNFRCGNTTSCLPKTKKCDGVVDCWDKSDETNCTATGCAKDMIPCLSGDCISKQSFCDGVFDCADKSDEPQGCQLK